MGRFVSNYGILIYSLPVVFSLCFRVAGVQVRPYSSGSFSGNLNPKTKEQICQLL